MILFFGVFLAEIASMTRTWTMNAVQPVAGLVLAKVLVMKFRGEAVCR
jgi:hypothetical protein